MNAVVAHPRSGTTFVTELLNLDGEVARHELLASASPDGVRLPTAYYEGRATEREVAALFTRYADTPGIRIDVNWKLCFVLPPFLSAFPGARVVHLARDPRDVVRSCVDLDYYGTLRHHPDFAADEVRNFWLSHMPVIRREGFAELDQLGKNCAFWVETERLVREALASHPLVLELRLEDLLMDDAAVARLFDFFGLRPPEPSDVRALRARKVNARSEVKARVARHKPPLPAFWEWTVRERAQLVDLCGPTAAMWGYDLSRS